MSGTCPKLQLGIDCIAEINLYSEFVITMGVPVLGILVVYFGYRCCLWRTHQSISTAATDEAKDAEKRGEPLDRDGEVLALADRRSRDTVVYLAIGWLFLVYTCVVFQV